MSAVIDTTATELTPELLDLFEHEKVIEQGLSSFIDVRVWRQRGNLAPRYLLFTSDMPAAGSEQRRLLDQAEVLGDITIIHLPYAEASA